MLGYNLVSDLLRQFFGFLSFLHAHCGTHGAAGLKSKTLSSKTQVGKQPSHAMKEANHLVRLVRTEAPG